MRKHNISVKKYYDKTQNCPVLELSITPELAELLLQYAIREQKKDTHYFQKIVETNEGGTDEDVYLQRFLVRTSFMNSVNNSYGGWLNIFDLFFTEELLTTHNLIIPLNSAQTFNDFERKLENLKEFIKCAEQLLTNKTLNIEFNVQED